MSLTSYRAAPPRDKLWGAGCPARGRYLATDTRIGKSARHFFVTSHHTAVHRNVRLMSAEPELDPRQPIGPSLVAIARAMLAQAAHETRAETDAIAIHGVRTAMKRWRAYLRLLEPFVGEDGARLRREARDLARGLAGARDAQSALDALSDFGEEYVPFSEKSLATITQRIEALRSSAESATLKAGAREQLANAFTLTLDSAQREAVDAVTLKDSPDSQ